MRIGIDVGGTWLRLGAWDGRSLTHFEKLPAARSARDLAAAIKDYISRRAIAAESAALAIPGTLDEARRAVLNTPNLDLGGEPLACRIVIWSASSRLSPSNCATKKRSTRSRRFMCPQ